MRLQFPSPVGRMLGRTPRTHVLFVEGFDWHRTLLAPLVPFMSDWATHETIAFPDVVHGARPVAPPDVVVMCDAGMANAVRELFPDRPIVHVGHGLISKNQTAYHYAGPDYICVASEFVAAMLRQRGHVPRHGFLATGLMQTDPLFSPLARYVQSHQPPAPTTITYAPTWNPTLSSAEMIGPNVMKQLWASDEDVRIFIKPHPHIATANPEWIAMWQDEAERSPHVHLCDPRADLIPTLLQSDLLVSDASSAIFHFLALDRPIVLIDNPERFSDASCFDEDGIEWRWRDVGARVDDAAELSRAVREELARPESRGEVRRQRRAQLFGELTDGRSTERISAALRQIAMARL